MSKPLLNINVQSSKVQLGAIDTPQLLYIMADIHSPKDAAVSKMLPLNITLVVDKSTSMKGERLRRLKEAANLVVDKLSVGDIISVVSYSDRAEVVVPSTKLNNKTAIQNRILGILASGGTEIFQGLAAGMKELAQVPLNDYVSHLILLTDGHTYGDDQQCLELAQKAAAKGIGISAFGIGSEWNDEFLDAIVGPSGGQSGYISEPEQIIHFLRQRIQGLGALYAQNVRLAANLPEGITIVEGFKLSPFAQPLKTSDAVIQLGAIEGRMPLSILLELNVDPLPAGRTIMLPLSFKAQIPSHSEAELSINNVQNFAVVSHPRDRRMPESLVKAVQILNLYRMNEKVVHDLDLGHVDAATKRMENLTRRFKEAGFVQLAKQANAETQRLSLTGSISTEGRKQLKYGTRTQLTSSLDFDIDASNGME
ncbi:MAG: VWA domain-containing protein [Anaerolineales bacterium]|nr:VWA domain-containing protein [Anaerolineales bacterium]